MPSRTPHPETDDLGRNPIGPTLVVTLTVVGTFTGCVGAPDVPSPEPPSFKRAFAGRFLVGAALNAKQFTGRATRDAALVQQQFDLITPEDVLKWALVHPEPDRSVEFGETNGMLIIGHTLLWHHQTLR